MVTATGGMSVWRRLALTMFSLALLATGLFLTALSAQQWDGSLLPLHVPWWSLAPGYLVVYRLLLDYEYRKEKRSFCLTHVPLAIGIVFIAPWSHLLARTLAAATSFVINRQRPAKLLFNLAITCFETGLAIYVLVLIQAMPHASHRLWFGILLAVILSETVSQCIIEVLLKLVGAPQSWEDRAVAFATVTASAVVFGGASVMFVAAAWTEPLTLVGVVVVGVALIVGYRRHRLLGTQHQQASSVQEFVRGLGAVDLSEETSAVVLDHMRSLLHAETLELAVKGGGQWRRMTLTEGSPIAEDTPPAESVIRGEEVPSSATFSGTDSMSTPLLGSSGLLGVLTVRHRFGDRGAFDIHDLRSLESLAAELASALERGQLQRDLAIAATTDSLTQLPNMNEATRLLAQLLVAGEGVILATIAVDSFREVNDTLGHEVGDELLCEVTRRLHLTFPGALLARIGGGRFAVAVASDTFGGDAAMFGLGLRAQVEGGAQLGPIGTHIKLSVGCVQAPEHGDDADTLIRRAETAMYGARNANGGPVVWEPVYEVQGQRRLAVVMALRDAVANGAIGVAYQPKIRMADDSVAGVEALARWTHPALGAISPAEFIPLAEAAGLMGPLTTLVLRQALTTCKSWQRRGGRIGVAVNVSAETLLDPMFATEVAALLTAVNVSPDLLTLELTEGVVVNDAALAAQRMTTLRQLGVKLSVDDFGTGYSSLTYLKGLPVDEVKIDKGFVDHVTEDTADRAVVRAVVDIAHTMGLTVVAEGVENNDQLRTLTELGVDEAQGYLLARPMAALDMAQWLRRREAAGISPDAATTDIVIAMPSQRD